jgi:hypothetical protein
LVQEFLPSLLIGIDDMTPSLGDLGSTTHGLYIKVLYNVQAELQGKESEEVALEGWIHHIGHKVERGLRATPKKLIHHICFQLFRNGVEEFQHLRHIHER